MKIRMPQIVREQVEQELKDVLYKEKTLELMDETVRHIQGFLGKDYIVGYQPSEGAGVKFIIATKLTPDAEYTIWTASLDPVKWEPNAPTDDEDPVTPVDPGDDTHPDESNEGTNENGDPPPPAEE